MIWCASKSGKNSTKLGYQLCEGQKNMESWPHQLCWNKLCMPKAGAFAWLAFKGRILTDDRRYKYGFIGPSRCSLCMKEVESANHLLAQCTFAQHCWALLKQHLCWSTPLPGSVKGIFHCWPNQSHKSIYSYLWKVSLAQLIWEIWKERNRRIFQGKMENANCIWKRIHHSIVECINANSAPLHSQSSYKFWDSMVQKHWTGIKNKWSNDGDLYRIKKIKRKEIRW